MKKQNWGDGGVDKISLIGLTLGLGAVLGGQVLEGGHLGSLMQFTAFIIVMGGTMGATMLQHSPRVFMQGIRMLGWVFTPPRTAPLAQIAQIVEWSHAARRGGLLSLEPLLNDIQDPYTKKGLQLLVDGAEPEYLKTALEVEISAFEDHFQECARVWQAAGGYAPTIGILGAVMGLIHVMENLTDPSKLGAGIAVAFVATIYGVGSANLLFLPIASKLKGVVARQVQSREILVEGLISIANGENPRMIETKLQGHLIGDS